jgi:hypothetical protein
MRTHRKLGTAAALNGFVRVSQGRFQNDAGWLGIRCLTEFSGPFCCISGNEDDLQRRLDRAVGAGRNAVRYLLMAENLFQFRPSMLGYWEAIDRATALAHDRSLYVEPCLFADAQIVLPSHEDRKALTRDYGQWCKARPEAIPQLSNEPFKNGWTGATDPQLLELADIFASAYGADAFSVGDPQDIVTDEAGNPLRGDLQLLSHSSDILVLHGARDHDPSRYARWVDHLKGFTDFRNDAQIRACGLWHDEPMGMASTFQPGRRDNRAEALVAAACCSAIFQIAYTTHYISSQDDVIPGLQESAIAALIPHGPDWQFINAAIGGSPVTGYDGFEKVRPATNGNEAWACAFGLSKGTIHWAEGYRPERVFNGANVEVWRASK